MEYLTWSTLPQHILVNVFSYLPVNDRLRASQTCKSWSECFHSPLLWSKFVFKFDTDIDSEGKAINCIENYCGVLKDVQIYINQSQKISRDRACYVMDELTALSKKKLQKFTFHFTGVNPLCFNGREILSKLKKLFSRDSGSEIVFHLSFVDLNHCNIAFDNELISIFAKQHHALRVFKMQNSCLIDNVTPTSLLELAKNCVVLEELHTFYHSINADVVKAFAEKGRAPFKHLSLLCNRSDKFSDLIPTEAWNEFSSFNPTAEVTIKFHHSMPHHIIIPLLCPGMPLVALDLKVYAWLAEELAHIAATFSSTLKILSFHPSMDWRLKAPPGVEPALLELVSRSDKLQELYCFCGLNYDAIEKIKKMRALKKSTLYVYNPTASNDSPYPAVS